MYLFCLFVDVVGGVTPTDGGPSSTPGTPFAKFSQQFTPNDQEMVVQKYASRMLLARAHRISNLQETAHLIRPYLPGVNARKLKRAERQRQKEIEGKRKKSQKKQRKGGSAKEKKQKKNQKLGLEANRMMMETLAMQSEEEKKLRIKQRKDRKLKRDEKKMSVAQQPGVAADEDSSVDDVNVVDDDDEGDGSNIDDYVPERLVPYEIVDQGRSRPSMGSEMKYRICWCDDKGVPIREPDDEVTWELASKFDGPDYALIISDWKRRRPKKFNAKHWQQ
jgi:hypothetical protein